MPVKFLAAHLFLWKQRVKVSSSIENFVETFSKKNDYERIPSPKNLREDRKLILLQKSHNQKILFSVQSRTHVPFGH